MSNVPQDLKFAASHEWARLAEDGTVLVGISDHAQAALGDLVYVEVPEAGTELKAGDSCAVVESVKAASDVYAPVSGTVVDSNVALAEAPELVNEQPYKDGWLMRIEPSAAQDLDKLMDAAAYEATLEE